MRVFQIRGAYRVSAVLALSVVLLFTLMFSPWAAPERSGDAAAYGADYSVGTEAELLAAIADAPDGSVITVTGDITLENPLKWDDKKLTIRGSSPEIALSRGSGVGSEPMIVVGGLDPSQTTPAGLTLRDITIDDKDNQDGDAYDGIVCAYRQGVAIDLESGATLTNSGSGSGVYLSSSALPGPTLDIREGSRIMNADIGDRDGAGVFAGLGVVFTMHGGLIQNNKTSAGDGGGVYVAGGARFVMKSGLIKGNTSSAGGGVLVSGDGTGGVFVMEGGSVTGNTVPESAAKNRQGWDVAVEAPSGADPALVGAAPGYANAAFSVRIYPGAIIGSGKVGVQNVTDPSYAPAGKAFNQAVFVPNNMSASVCVGALNQYDSTAVLDALTSPSSEALITAEDSAALSGLTYAGNVMYSPPSNTGNIRLTLNYPDEMPTYDADGMNVRNRYGYALVYVPLDASGAAIGSPKLAIPARAFENIIVEFPAEPGAAAYGVVKYYYDKSGEFEVDLSGAAGGSLIEKTGLPSPLQFENIISGSAIVPSPAAFTLKTAAQPGWRVGAVTLTAGDGYVITKDPDGNGEFLLYYTDLAKGVNKIEVSFVKIDGSIDLSMDDASFVYDGNPHRVAVSGIIPSDEVSFMYRVGDSGFIPASGNPEFTDVNGVIAGNVTGAVTDEEIVVYAIVTRGAVSERESAILTITPRPVTVKPVDRAKAYDGSPLTPNGVELSSGTLVSGHMLELSSAMFTGSQTNPGTSASNVSGVSVAGTNPSNYLISYAPGSLTVTGTIPDVDEPDDPDEPDEPDKPDKPDKPKKPGGNKGGGGGGSVPSPAAGVTDDSEDEDVDEEESTDEEPVDDGEVDEPGTGIDEPPIPTTSDGGKDDGEVEARWWSWWPLLIAVFIAALLIWFLIAYRRKREKDDEDSTDEKFPRR